MQVYISYVNSVAKARLLTAQLTIFTADCLRHTVQMAGVETIWVLHSLVAMNSCLYSFLDLPPLLLHTVSDQKLDGGKKLSNQNMG